MVDLKLSCMEIVRGWMSNMSYERLFVLFCPIKKENTTKSNNKKEGKASYIYAHFFMVGFFSVTESIN